MEMRMLVKRFMGYLFYTLLVGVIIYWGVKYGQLRIQAGRTFKPHLSYAFISCFPIVIGMLLAVPGLVLSLKQVGKWIIDWQMLLPVGIPTLVFNISLFLNNPFLYKFDWYRLIFSDTRVYDISGIVFGYVLLSSLKRASLTKENDIPSGNEISS